MEAGLPHSSASGATARLRVSWGSLPRRSGPWTALGTGRAKHGVRTHDAQRKPEKQNKISPFRNESTDPCTQREARTHARDKPALERWILARSQLIDVPAARATAHPSGRRPAKCDVRGWHHFYAYCASSPSQTPLSASTTAPSLPTQPVQIGIISTTIMPETYNNISNQRHLTNFGLCRSTRTQSPYLATVPLCFKLCFPVLIPLLELHNRPLQPLTVLQGRL